VRKKSEDGPRKNGGETGNSRVIERFVHLSKSRRKRKGETLSATDSTTKKKQKNKTEKKGQEVIACHLQAAKIEPGVEHASAIQKAGVQKLPKGLRREGGTKRKT